MYKNLAELGSSSSFSLSMVFYCWINLSTKKAWVKLLTYKTGKTVIDCFIRTANECKPNKL